VLREELGFLRSVQNTGGARRKLLAKLIMDHHNGALVRQSTSVR